MGINNLFSKCRDPKNLSHWPFLLYCCNWIKLLYLLKRIVIFSPMFPFLEIMLIKVEVTDIEICSALEIITSHIKNAIQGSNRRCGKLTPSLEIARSAKIR